MPVCSRKVLEHGRAAMRQLMRCIRTGRGGDLMSVCPGGGQRQLRGRIEPNSISYERSGHARVGAPIVLEKNQLHREECG